MSSKFPWPLLVAAIPLALGTTSCKSKESKGTSEPLVAEPEPTRWDAAATPPEDAAPLVLPPAPPLAATPLGLPTPPSPDFNPTTAEKVALGEILFGEKALSLTGEVACSTCHDADHGYANAKAINPTAAGNDNQRHTPTLLNVAYHEELYWDGRSAPLEGHILGHWQGQLGVAPVDAVASIASQPLYIAHFERAFNTDPDKDRAAEALAAYVRTRLSGNSAWDRYEAGDASAVSADAIAGAEIFNRRAGCATCHAPPLYTDLKFHDLGLPEGEVADVGREVHTKNPADRGKFKTPSLRAASQSAPYFHNGSASTLIQVLEHKESQGSPRLSAQERKQLLAFIAALSSESEP